MLISWNTTASDSCRKFVAKCSIHQTITFHLLVRESRLSDQAYLLISDINQSINQILPVMFYLMILIDWDYLNSIGIDRFSFSQSIDSCLVLFV